MIDASTPVSVWQLLRKSSSIIWKHRIPVFICIVLFAAILTISDATSFSFVHCILIFSWFKLIAIDNAADSTSKTDWSRGSGKFFLNFLLFGIFIVLVAFIAGGAIKTLLSFEPAPTGDIMQMTFKIVPWVFGGIAGLVFMIRILPLFPAIVFGHKTSLKLAWSQSREWFWRLLWCSFLTTIIPFTLFLVVGLSTSISPSSIEANVIGAVLGVLSDLFFAGYVAYAYLAIIENPQTVTTATASRKWLGLLRGFAMAGVTSFLLSWLAAFVATYNPLLSSLIMSTQPTYADALQDDAEHGDAEAECELGYKYYVGDGTFRQDLSKALKLLRKSAEQGNPCGMYNLGIAYHEGKAVAQDYTEALKWWQKAAEKDFPAAEYNLGVLYYNGEMGLPKDDAQALKWLKKAADQGDEPARAMLEEIKPEVSH